MKRFNLFSSFIFLFSVIFLASCQFIAGSYNRPVREYFESNIEEVAVMKHVFNCQVLKDKNGVPCIPSGQDRTITLYLRNAKEYMLDLGIDAKDSSVFVNPDKARDYNIAMKDTDPSVLIITLYKDYLQKMEKNGGEFSPTITLADSVSGREFDSYQFNVRIDSAPPEISDAIVMLDGNDEYVLCFNLAGKDIVGDIHQDIESVFINGTEFKLDVNNDGVISPSSEAGSSLVSSLSGRTLKQNTYPGSSDSNSSSTPSFPSADDGKKKSFYYLTNEKKTEENIRYKIELKDKMGLKSTISTSVYAEKLSPPKIFESDKETAVDPSTSVSPYELTAGANGSMRLWLKVPSNTVKGTAVKKSFVKYTVILSDGNSLSGKISQDAYINIQSTSATIVCQSTMDDYIDSDTVTAYVKARTN